MRKLFGLFLLSLVFLMPNAADAASCFWVGGTATWDTTNTGGGGAGGIKWASTSGGGTACAGGGTGGSPTAADTATFDGSSGGGTITVNYGGLISITSLTIDAFTGTLDFATNNNSITLSSGTAGFSATGASTKTLNMGSGTWTLSGNSALWNCTTCTNLTLNAGTSTIAFTGSGGANAKRMFMGGKTYATISIGAGGTPIIFSGGSSTIGTLTIAGPQSVIFSSNTTYTVTTLSDILGSSSIPVLFGVDGSQNGKATISSANNFTCSWCGFSDMTFSGGGTFTATNSFNFGNNSGVSISGPSGGGGRIIGG